MTSLRLALVGPVGLVFALASGGCSLIDGLQGTDDPDEPDEPGEPGEPGGPGNPGNPACVTGNFTTSVSVDTTVTPDDEELDYDGPVTVTRHEDSPDSGRITLQTEVGDEFGFEYQMAGDTIPVEAGDQHHATIVMKSSVNGNSRNIALGIRAARAGAADPDAPLVTVLWSTSDLGMLDQVATDFPVFHTLGTCSAVDDGCAERANLDLEATLPGMNQSILLSPGRDFVASGTRIVNSSTTFQYLSPCPDEAEKHASGHVVLLSQAF